MIKSAGDAHNINTHNCNRTYLSLLLEVGINERQKLLFFGFFNENKIAPPYTGCPRKNETHFQFLITVKLFNP